MEMPATRALMGDARVRAAASVPPQTEAMLEEPLDSRMSEIRRMV